MAMDDSAGSSAGSEDACELTETQAVSIRAVLATFNSSCDSYNLTAIGT